MQILKDEIRTKILIVAENMFYEKGFKETTTRSIAKTVGISVSNLYLYYENKEALFYVITDSFYEYFIDSLENLLQHDDSTKEMDTNISSLIQNMIKVNHKKFVILMDRCQGTKYEGLKHQVIMILNNHIKIAIKSNLLYDELIIYIIAKNFFEGMIEIAKNYRDEISLKNNINTLVKYHMTGIKHML